MKNTIITATVLVGAIVLVFASLSDTPVLPIRPISEAENEIIRQPVIRWQKIKISEDWKNVLINITVPRVIYGDHDLGLRGEVNEAIMRHIESLNDDFMSGVTTAAEDNGEASTLNINTEILLSAPRLFSLAFTATKHWAGMKDNDPERTYLIFDLISGRRIIDSFELFRDQLAWSKAVVLMKASLLSQYQGDPSCDLSFAPRSNGLAASCIGVDWGRGGTLSITQDLPISMIQEFLSSSVLSDIIR